MPSTEVKSQSDIQSLPVRRYDDFAAAIGRSRISWGSVFAGSAIGLVVQLWLSMLGVAIGASTIDPLQEANPLAGLGVGSAIWLAITVIISSYIGGWIAGRFAGTARREETTIHGAASWAVSNIATFLLIGSVFGAIMGGLARVGGAAMSAAGNVAGSAIQGGQGGGAGQGGGQGQGPVDRAIANAQQGASNVLNQARGGAGGTGGTTGGQGGGTAQVQAQARQASDVAAQAVSRTGWGIVIMMLLGLGASLMGAAAARPMNSAYSRQP